MAEKPNGILINIGDVALFEFKCAEGVPIWNECRVAPEKFGSNNRHRAIDVPTES